ncbi:ATP-binding protein (plasmid) [Deinococcus taeanensis]|uniref:protein DpdH n=1 Tax=Deinococcus taeanensis TaxID=2737050 RepID=UPI001CDBCB9C|nr:protein DpdH [Deinococcus taeanensis]UBV45562.1 ATP-binding protein [Deinococcus taeanensis]
MTPPFARYVCWKEDAVSNVLVDVASRPSEAVFLATHQAPLMWRSTSYLNPDWTLMTEGELLREFLDDRATKVFMPIIGASGTGKSHLIRWLASQIKSTPTRRVISIPKHETNLRSVLNLILEGLEGERFEDFRTRLKNAASGLTREDARWSLLTNLVKLIEDLSGHEQITTESGVALGTSELKYLQQQLPAFLLEEAVRKQLDSEQSVIDRFVTEALSGRTEDKAEAFRIRVHDIPFSIRNAAAASEKVKKFYMVVSNNKALQEKTIAVLNHFLAPALQRIYQLGGDDLLLLMRDVRKALAGRQELVLLIEDFALLQGIQAQLLEAFIDDDTQDLCLMRVALAVTRGYFNNMDTVHTRMTTVVSLDEGDAQQESPLRPMTAAYLNASRWGAAALEKGIGQLRRSEQQESRCRTCPFQTVCHQTFGSIAIPQVEGEVGLYPLNATALDKVAEVEMPGNLFNPRFLLRGLRTTLEEAQRSLPDAEFPTAVFDHRYAKPQEALSPHILGKIRQLGSSYPQVEAVLSVWATADDLRVLHTLPIAFGLDDYFPPETVVKVTPPPPPDPVRPTPPLPDPVRPTPPLPDPVRPTPPPPDPVRPTPPPPDPVRPTPPPPAPVPALVQALRNWVREKEKVLTQGVMGDLKGLVYQAVNDELNWTGLNIQESSIKGLGVWGPENISFDEQMNAFTGKAESLRLNLPVPGTTRLSTALVLEALYSFGKTGQWPKETPDVYWQVRDHLKKWSHAVHIQVSQHLMGIDGPLHAAVQVVLTSQEIDGALMGSDPNTALKNLLRPWSKTSSEALEPYAVSRDLLCKAYGDAQNTIVGLASVRKGQDGGPLLLDTSRLRPLVVEVVKNLNLRQLVSEHPWDAHGLAKALLNFKRSAQTNAAILRRQAGEARDAICSAFGDDLSAIQIARIADAMSEASAAGTLQVEGRFEQDRLNQSVERLLNTDLAELAAQLSSVIQESDDLKVLRVTSQLNWKAVQDVLRTITQLEKVLKSSLQKTEMEIRKAEALSETTSVIRQINDDFEHLKQDLATLSQGRA